MSIYTKDPGEEQEYREARAKERDTGNYTQQKAAERKRDQSAVVNYGVSGGIGDLFIGAPGGPRNFQSNFPDTTNSPGGDSFGFLMNQMDLLNISPNNPGGFFPGQKYMGVAPMNRVSEIGVSSPFKNNPALAQDAGFQALLSYNSPYVEENGQMVLRPNLQAGDMTAFGEVEAMPPEMYQQMRESTGQSFPSNLYIKGANPFTSFTSFTEDERRRAVKRRLPDSAFLDEEANFQSRKDADDRQREREHEAQIAAMKQEMGVEPKRTPSVSPTARDPITGKVLFLDNPVDAQRHIDLRTIYPEYLRTGQVPEPPEPPEPPGGPLVPRPRPPGGIGGLPPLFGGRP